jgi:hypothetical protein
MNSGTVLAGTPLARQAHQQHVFAVILAEISQFQIGAADVERPRSQGAYYQPTKSFHPRGGDFSPGLRPDDEFAEGLARPLG